MTKRGVPVFAGTVAVAALAFALPGWIASRNRPALHSVQSFDQDLGRNPAAKKTGQADSPRPDPTKEEFYRREFQWTGADKKPKRAVFSLAKARVKNELNRFGVARGMEHSLLLQKKGFKRVGVSRGLEVYMVDYQKIFRDSLDYFSGLTRTLVAALEPPLAENDLIEFLFFVQSITYDKPPFYYNNKFINSFFPPLICLYEQFGDCDSKSVLLAVFLTCRNQKEKTALAFINSQGMKHSILLVKRTPNPGMSALFIKGSGYYIPLEASAPGWAPGFVNPRIWDALRTGNFRFSELQ
jgi:hypothetical protein